MTSKPVVHSYMVNPCPAEATRVYEVSSLVNQRVVVMPEWLRQ
jgi:hypothetical protein